MRTSTTKPAQKLDGILRGRRMSRSHLAAAVGISVRSLHNICCGNSSSIRARRAIQDLLQTQMWDDIPLEPAGAQSPRSLILGQGVEILSSTIQEAEKIAKTFRGSVKRRGKVVCFIKSIPVVILNSSERPSRSKFHLQPNQTPSEIETKP